MDPNGAALLGIGLVAGVLGGLLGIGGSIIMIPAMTVLFGPEQHLYQGAAMIVNFFVVLPAVTQHRRAGAIVPPVVMGMIPAALAGVCTGVWLSDGAWFSGANEVYLTRLFGGFLLYASSYNVYRLLVDRRLPELTAASIASIPRWRPALLVGLPMGIAGGLLGVGGGIVAVPLQQLVLRIPLRRAIANSATTILPLSILGASYKNYLNHTQAVASVGESIGLAAWLIPAAIIGGLVGGRLTHVAPRKVLRLAVVCLMFAAGIRMLRRPVVNDTSTARMTGSAASADGNGSVSKAVSLSGR